MNLSRMERRRYRQSRVVALWILAAVLLLFVLALIAVVYVRSADSIYRLEKRQAIHQALSEGGLTGVEYAEKYTWEQSYWVIRGKDADGEEWMLWLHDGEIFRQKLSEGYSEAQIRSHFAAQRPEAVPIRILPGWMADQPVWEIRYRKQADSEDQGMDFYAFRDAKLIKTYDLPGF